MYYQSGKDRELLTKKLFDIMSKLVKILGEYPKIRETKDAFAFLGLLKRVFPDYMQQAGFAQYLGNVVSTIIANPPKDSYDKSLWDCSIETILGGISKAWVAGFSLDPVMREAYLIPYAGKAQFQIGYIGLCKIAQKQNLVPTAIVIFENDVWSGLQNINGSFVWTHKAAPNRNQYKDNPIGCLAIIRNKQTGAVIHAVYLSVAEIEVLRLRNGSQQKGKKQAWATDYSAMMQAKTIKHALTRGLATNSDIEMDDKVFTLTDNPISPIQTENVEYSDVTPFVAQIDEYKKQFEEFSQIAGLERRAQCVRELTAQCFNFLVEQNKAGITQSEPLAMQAAREFYEQILKPFISNLNPAQ